ncbi:ATP-binding protein (plasmid) [Deinococcus sp. KNUC1210]|uniref:ATP-binding protein n=1 Tax=Deinococcus sp. KNUC1210 TaxID=2917691 RepID=UPI001EEFEFC2|nr:ATP-binding protein [Deinococcus sp. KNUC1210]ULH17498.1 ATP-binding protein [Deinococcus sp. KNUC1210]
MNAVLLTLPVANEQTVVEARFYGRQLAAVLGFGVQDQTRVATAVSELARNALLYAGRGKIEYGTDLEAQQLTVQVSDQGPGIASPGEVLSGRYVSTTGMGRGLSGTRRLMDHLDLDTGPSGTRVFITKKLPTPLGTDELPRIQAALLQSRPVTPVQELQRQNKELLQTLGDLARREQQLATLNRELEDTNRGVVALYSELEDKAAQLREASREKSMFLSYVSHEFRTPLHSMLGLSRLLLSHADGSLSQAQEQQLTLLRSSAEELLGMVNDLLDMTKAEAGGRDLKLEPLELTQILATLRALFQPLITETGPRLIIAEPQTPVILYSDASKLHQILRNFISNALKFTPAGEVVVSTRLTEDDNWIEFSVQDSGPGISPEDQRLLFREYSQLRGGGKKGSGLGLALSHRLATLLGGRVGVESVPGAGARFWTVLPLRSAAPLGQTPAVGDGP